MALLKNNKHHSIHLQNAWNKYGEENFEFEIIMYCDSEMCVFFEQKCFDVYNPQYNILRKSDSSYGYKHSKESKLKMSQNRIGRKHTEETKRKISLSYNGDNSRIGSRHSEETKQKMSLSRKGKRYSGVCKLTPEQVEEIRLLFPKIKESYKEFSKRYNVSSQTIFNIVKRKQWKD